MKPGIQIKNTALILALAAVYPLYGHAAAGIAQFTSGDVNVRRGATLVALAKGRDLESGDAIQTGAAGRAQIRFTDGGIVSLQPNSQFDITRYVDANDPAQDSFLVNFARGSMRAITGLIGKRNRENYKVQTATATVGIRGSGFSASYNPDGSIAVSSELDEIEVCTKGGCVRLTAGESCLVVNNDEPPARGQVRANLPTPPPRQEITVVGNRVTNAGLSALITVPAHSVVVPQPVVQTVTGLMASFAGASGAQTTNTGANTVGTDLFTLETAPAAAAAEALRQAVGPAPGPILVPSTNPATQLIKSVSSTDGMTNQKLALASYDSRGKVTDADFIGWGHWATARQITTSTTTVNDLHYVVGKPTPDAAVSALSGFTGTFGLIGGTASFKPYTGGSSVLGSVIGGSLSVQFNNPGNSNFVTGSLDTKFGATVVNVNLGTASGCGARFSGGAANVAGFFTGANATRAGLTFNANTGSLGSGTISGSAAFTRTSLTPPS